MIFNLTCLYVSTLFLQQKYGREWVRTKAFGIKVFMSQRIGWNVRFIIITYLDVWYISIKR